MTTARILLSNLKTRSKTSKINTPKMSGKMNQRMTKMTTMITKMARTTLKLMSGVGKWLKATTPTMVGTALSRGEAFTELSTKAAIMHELSIGTSLQAQAHNAKDDRSDWRGSLSLSLFYSATELTQVEPDEDGDLIYFSKASISPRDYIHVLS